MPIQPTTRSPRTPLTPRAADKKHRRDEHPTEKAERARTTSTPGAPPTPPKAAPRLMPLPDVRQGTTYTCGTASLMSILAYYGWKGGDPNEKALAKELGTSWQNGTEPEEILKMARALGISATQREHMTLDDLARELRAGHPVMVAYQAYADDDVPAKKSWADDWGDGHWSIVIGLDRDNVYLEDPSMLGKRGFIPREEFLERWHDTNRLNQPVYQHLGLVFSSDTPKADLNEVEVKKLEYVP